MASPPTLRTTTPDAAWEAFRRDVDQLNRAVSNSKAVNVNSVELRERAANTSRMYFRDVRATLRVLGVEPAATDHMDESMRGLLRLSASNSAKSSYTKLFRDLSKTMLTVTESIELRISEMLFLSQSTQASPLSSVESAIYETLMRLEPTAGRAYKQAIEDLSDPGRISYRGPANELREALREAVDKLAPDEKVQRQSNFVFEQGQTKPTTKQKVRFILKERKLPKNAVDTPEESLQIIDERIGAFARATLTRSSIDAHVHSERTEVSIVRHYVNAVLADLLEVHE